MPIPKVSPLLLDSTLTSNSHNPDFAKDQYKIMKDENPTLFTLIEAVIRTKDPKITQDFKEGYCKAAMQFYYLIKAQMECDELNGIPTT